MEYRDFGWTGVKVSTMGMGTYFDPAFIITARLFRHQGGRAQKVAALQAGLDRGITLIDTAEIYQTEDIVADAIAGRRREDLFIMTKVFRHHMRSHQVLKAAENSVARLRCAYIDLYQIHWPNPRVPIDETMKAMKQLVADGTIRFVGVSNFSLDLMQQAEAALAPIPLAANQVEYNLMARQIEADLLPYCEAKRIAVLPYRPLAHGALAAPSARLKAVMDGIAQKHGKKTPAQIAVNWLLTKSPVIFPIPRASRPERVIENVGAVGWSLDADDMRALENAVRAAQ